MTLLRTYATVALLAASAVNADDFVDRADANSDGYVSLYELRAAYYADAEFNRRIEQSFVEYDTDGDGLISAAERRAQLAETPAAAETPATAETAATPAVADETPVAETTVAPAIATAAATPAKPETTATSSLADATPTPAASAETTAAPVVAATAATAAEIAPTPAAGTKVAPAVPATVATATRVSEDSLNDATRINESDDRSPESSTAASVGTGSLLNAEGLSSAELRIREIDTDNSGGASVAELVASGDGSQWFSTDAFEKADRNSDGDLNAEELDVLLQSLQRRRR